MLPSSSAWACPVRAWADQLGLFWASPSSARWQHRCCLPSAYTTRAGDIAVSCLPSEHLATQSTDGHTARCGCYGARAVGEVPLMSYQTLLSNKRFPLFPYFWPGGREGAASQRGSKSKRRKCVNVCPHTDLSTFKRRERQRPKEAIASYAEIDSCDEGFLHAAFAISSTTRPQARSRTLLLLWSTFRLRLIRFGQ